MISRAKLGDIAAFTDLVEMYYPRCLRFARAVLQNPDEVEDVVQDTSVSYTHLTLPTICSV